MLHTSREFEDRGGDIGTVLVFPVFDGFLLADTTVLFVSVKVPASILLRFKSVGRDR